MRWGKNCVIFEISWTAVAEWDNLPEVTLTTSAAFQINNVKLYIPVFTLSIKNDIKFLENIGILGKNIDLK